MTKAKDNLIWLDLEMTGLNPEHDKILELATVVTDASLNIIAQGPVFAIFQSTQILQGMDEWNTSHHNASGLVQRVQESSVDEAQAEDATLKFLQEFVENNTSPMCGNTIWQDRRFLVKYMPKLNDFFHYRNIDVSTIKELARLWQPSVLDGVKKQSKHIALDDIKDSIEELRYYREHFITNSKR